MNVFRILWWPLRKRLREAAAATPQAEMTLEAFEKLDPVVKVQGGETEVTYCTPNRFVKWRVDTLFDKEPDTIDWIGNFSPGDVFVDIGANVGMYTIWAAKTRSVRVFAFEPESQNFALLNKNIVVNGLGDTATAFCLALSDESSVSMLHLSHFSQGGSGHTFGAELDHNLKARASPYAQGCVCTTLDRLVETGVIPVPTHIKIDVDGLEHKVIDGARATLRDQRLKSVLVEINSNLGEHNRIVQDLVDLGFGFSDEQVQSARRTEGPATGTGNYVFRR